MIHFLPSNTRNTSVISSFNSISNSLTCEVVVNVTRLLDAFEVIAPTVGFSSSTLVIVCVIVSVATLPPVSVAVTVTVTVLEPKLKSLTESF